MVNPTTISLRAKKLGALIADARTAKSKNIEDCAKAMGVSPEAYAAYEIGQVAPSLPELELLAHYLDIPLDHFWGNTPLSRRAGAEEESNLKLLLDLRNRLIGATLRKHRLEAGLSLDETAEKAGIQPETLESYELGQRPVPVTILEVLAETLRVGLKEFYDKKGPVGKWASQQQMIHDFLQLPPEMQAFVSKPVNRPYLELAQRLGDLSVDKLRSVAEVLLEITL